MFASCRIYTGVDFSMMSLRSGREASGVRLLSGVLVSLVTSLSCFLLGRLVPRVRMTLVFFHRIGLTSCCRSKYVQQGLLAIVIVGDDGRGCCGLWCIALIHAF